MFTFNKILKCTLLTHLTRRNVTGKEVKTMKKIMAGRDKGKRRWHYDEFPKMVSAQKLSNAEGQGKEANRRITVLNKLFMKNVTDLLATGLFSEVLVKHSIQISNIKVSSDFKKLNVYWISDDACDEDVDKQLRSIAGPLRHELSVLRLMGEIPQINFCRDKSLARSSEVDALLRKADYGEDFTPTDPTVFIRTDKKLEMKLSDDIKNKIRELDNNNEDEIEEPLLVMRNDIYGLDHDRMMKSIMASMSKSTKAWESYSVKDQGVEQVVREPVDVDKLNRDAELREDFIKFLEKRQLEKKITPERKKFHKHFSLNDADNIFEDYKDLPDNDYIEDDK